MSETKMPDRLWTMHTKDGTPYRSRDDGPRLAWDYWPVPGLSPAYGALYVRADWLREQIEAMRERRSDLVNIDSVLTILDPKPSTPEKDA